jgi:hypothetical protein
MYNTMGETKHTTVGHPIPLASRGGCIIHVTLPPHPYSRLSSPPKPSRVLRRAARQGSTLCVLIKGGWV